MRQVLFSLILILLFSHAAEAGQIRAKQVTLDDVGNYYTVKDLESAMQQLKGGVSVIDSISSNNGTISLLNDTATPGNSKYYGTNSSGVNGWYTLGTGNGSVTSVSLTVPTFLTVTGSPITTSGTLGVSLSGSAIPTTSGGTGSITTRGAAANVGVYPTSPIGGNNSYVDPINTTPSYEGQLGLAYFGSKNMNMYVSGSTTKGDWNHAFSFNSGIQNVGVNPTYGMKMDNINTSVWNLNADPVGMIATGDSVFTSAGWSDSPANSGSGLCVAKMVDNGAGQVTDNSDIGSCFQQVSANRIMGLIPGWSMLVFNLDPTNNQGLTISSPGAPGNGFDTGNYSFVEYDFNNALTRFPYWVNGSYQPADKGILKTVTINNGGSGYSVGNLLDIVQGGASGGKVKVTTVSGGVITGIQIDSTELVTNGGWGRGYSVANGLSTTVGGILLCNINNGGIGYKVGDTLTVVQGGASSGTCSVASVNSKIQTVAVNAGGTGYTVGDILNITQSGAQSGSAIVTTVSGGVITGVAVNGPGYKYFSANGLSTSGGTGSGATLNITAGIIEATLVNAFGTKYATATGLATVGGTGSGATVNITSGGAGGTGATVNITAVNNWTDTLVINSLTGQLAIDPQPATTPTYNVYFNTAKESYYIGDGAGNRTESGTGDNLGFGNLALNSVTTGHENYAYGQYALQNLTTGNNNFAYGGYNLRNNVVSSNNLAIGGGALQSFVGDTFYGNNTAIGTSAMQDATSGVTNTCVGYICMQHAALGNYNAGFGGDTLTNTSGSDNTAVGTSAGHTLGAGTDNTLIGDQTGYSLSSGSWNILIGSQVGAPFNTSSNQLNIGNVIYGNGVTSGNSAAAGSKVGIGIAAPVAQLDVAPGSRLNSVRYVTSTVTTNSGSTLTLTAAKMAANTIFQETGTTAATFTLDTGANLSSAIPGTVQVGDCVWFVVSNASTQTITMSGASGTTLANAMTVATLQSRTFYAINTGSSTWTVY